MKNFLSFIIILSSIIFISSCDQIKKMDNTDYYVEGVSINNNTQNTDSVSRKTLLIDFTGIRCVNCPEAHEIINQIKTLHPNRVVAIAFHGTSLAYPIAPYKINLRTDEGNDVISTFGINAIPTGLINNFDKTKLQERQTWAATVDTSLEQNPSVEIKTFYCYNSSERELKTIILVRALKNMPDQNILSVYLLEDSIITRQATVEEPGYIENYVQLNVFRKGITNVWGEQVSGLSKTGDVITKEYSIILDTSWNENNCKIVAFLRNNSNFVLNAEESQYITKY